MHVAVNIHTGQLFDWVFRKQKTEHPFIFTPESDVPHDILVEGCKDAEDHFCAYAILSSALQIAVKTTSRKYEQQKIQSIVISELL
jgi:hypothetical protein